MMMVRRKNNYIAQILNENEALVSRPITVGEIFTNFFTKLFTSSRPTSFVDCLEDMEA